MSSHSEPGSILERVGRSIAVADAADFNAEARRYIRFAAAAFDALLHPTEEMIDAAQEAIYRDPMQKVPNRDDIRRAIEAMMASALNSYRS